MQYSERAARNSRSHRNRHNGHINAFKVKVMKTGNGFEEGCKIISNALEYLDA